MKHSAVAAIVLACSAAAPVAQEEPRSAIPWLSDVLADRIVVPAPPDAYDPIIVTRLNERMRDGLGILSKEQSGLSPEIWAASSVIRIRKLIETTPYAGVPALRSLFRKLLLAKFDPPKGSSAAANLLLARIDKLLEIGALAQAGALIDQAEPDTDALFQRWFDVALLTNNADEACEALNRSPMLSPAKNVQVFCLVRRGDWDAAAVTLTLGETLGTLSEYDSQLLSFFLDPALIEEEEPPAPRSPITALEFLIRESVGLPRPQSALPIAFLHADLAEYVPVRFKMQASERLVRAGVYNATNLFSTYRAEPPASSGGIWERANAVQKFDTTTDQDFVSDLLRLDAELSSAGLRLAAAQQVSDRLMQLTPTNMPKDARNIISVYLMLTAQTGVIGDWLSLQSPQSIRTAAIVAGLDHPIPPELTARNFAILQPFLAAEPEQLTDDRVRVLLEQERTGEAIMAAIGLLASEEDTDPGDLTRGLAALLSVGLVDAAQSIAVQLLVLDWDPRDG